MVPESEKFNDMRVVQCRDRYYIRDVPYVGGSTYDSVGARFNKRWGCFWVGTQELADIVVAEIRHYYVKGNSPSIYEYGPSGLGTSIVAAGYYNRKRAYAIESVDQFRHKRRTEARIQLCFAQGFDSYWVAERKFQDATYYKATMLLGTVRAYGIAMRYFNERGKYPAGFTYRCKSCGDNVTSRIRDICPVTRKEH